MRQLQEQLGGNRVVAGVYDSVGPTVVQGTGFTVSRNAVGDVTVTFTSPFAAPPAVTATLAETAGANIVKEKDGVAATALAVRLLSFNADSPFASAESKVSFVAVGLM